MDNEFTLSRLWTDAHLMETSIEQLQEIHSKIVDLFMNIFPSGVISDLSIDVVAKITVALVDITLKHQLHDNFMLPAIRDFAERLGTNPTKIVEGAIELWAQLSMRQSANDAFNDVGMESEVELDEDGELLLGYDYELAEEQQLIPDLGQLSMLLIADIWQPPSTPRLRTAYLMANSTTTMLFGAFAILPYLSQSPWERILKHNKDHTGLKLFLQTAWKLCRPAKSQAPSVKFAAGLRGNTLTKDGKNILTDTAVCGQEEASEWHPGRKVPGSMWNKYFQNARQPMFSTRARSTFPKLRFRIPSSLVEIITPFEDYYLDLRQKFDQNAVSRITPSDAELQDQFHSLASATGIPYPDQGLETWAAHLEQDIGSEILQELPWVKDSITNLNGHLSLPFLNTVAKAVRFQEEPEPDQQDIVGFGFDM